MTSESTDKSNGNGMRSILVVFGLLIVVLIFVVTYQYTQINYLKDRYSVADSAIGILDNRSIESAIFVSRSNNLAILRDIDVWKTTLTPEQISSLVSMSMKFNCLKMYDITAAGFGTNFVQFVWEHNNNTSILFDLSNNMTACTKEYAEADCNVLCSYIEL